MGGGPDLEAESPSISPPGSMRLHRCFIERAGRAPYGSRMARAARPCVQIGRGHRDTACEAGDAQGCYRPSPCVEHWGKPSMRARVQERGGARSFKALGESAQHTSRASAPQVPAMEMDAHPTYVCDWSTTGQCGLHVGSMGYRVGAQAAPCANGESVACTGHCVRRRAAAARSQRSPRCVLCAGSVCSNSRADTYHFVVLVVPSRD